MHISNLLSAATLCALATSVAGNPKPHNDLPKRPHVVAAPYGTGKAFPHSPPRSTKDLCYVKPTKGKKKDDSPRILKAFKKCNKGGTIVLDKNYTIASPLDLTWLSHVDVVITGEIHFKSDPYYWAENSFKYDFQNMSSFWKIGGKDINIYGDLSNDQSVLDGHGQDYWKEYVTNKTVSANMMQGSGMRLICAVWQLMRPILLTIEDAHGLTMSNMRMRNSPNVRQRSLEIRMKPICLLLLVVQHHHQQYRRAHQRPRSPCQEH